jgi:hypothetical protein
MSPALPAAAFTHPSIHAAAVDFFWKLTRRDTPWDCRAEWESKTGQYF